MKDKVKRQMSKITPSPKWLWCASKSTCEKVKVGIRLMVCLVLVAVALMTFPASAFAQVSDEAQVAASSVEAEAQPTTFPYKKVFVISAYYTPLPGQTKFVTGSYETDVRLNGEGVHAADGTLVYPGMAAAPKNYPFGTKMSIPGIGIVAVHDRGGAIKNNRLDIWVGEGEIGLGRAMAWGKRSVEVTVYGIDPNIKEEVDVSAMPVADLSYLGSHINTKYFNKDLSFGDEGEGVRLLQSFLKKLGYMDKDETGYFGEETRAAIRKFQLEEDVIEDEGNTGAGVFGPRSRVTMEAALEREKNKILNGILQITLKNGDKGDDVKRVQEILNRFGFLNEVNGVYDAKMRDALIKFQTEQGIINTSRDLGAGYYGPKTKDGVIQLVANYYTPSRNNSAKKVASAQITVPQNTYDEPLAFNDSGTDVELLQSELKRLNFFGLPPTGYYGKTTEHAVIKFQQNYGIIETEKDQGAGVVGPRTLDKLNELVDARSGQERLIAQTTNQKQLLASKLETEKQLVLSEIALSVFSRNIGYGTRGSDVEELQKMLKKLGFFEGRMTTQYFGDITQRSLIAFQKSHGVDGSGVVDEQTLRILNRILGEV